MKALADHRIDGGRCVHVLTMLVLTALIAGLIAITSAGAKAAGPQALIHVAPSPEGWAVGQPIDNDGVFSSISCASSTFCMAVGSAATRWNGKAWTPPQAVTGGGVLSSVSCPTSTFCLAVGTLGDQGVAASWTRGVWSRVRVIDPDGTLAAVSCPSTVFCMAVGAAAISWNGTEWSTPSSVDPDGDGMDAISCPTASFCLAGDEVGAALTWRGTSWSTPYAVNPEYVALTSVSCSSADFCMVLGLSGTEHTLTDGSWSGAVQTPLSHLDSFAIDVDLSCAASSSCMAIGGDTSNDVSSAQPLNWPLFGGSPEYTSSWNGMSWTPLHRLNAGRSVFGVTVAISCAGPGTCLVLANGRTGLGMASYAWEKNKWSPPVELDVRTGRLSSISCRTAAFCKAVDWSGDVLTWNGRSWSDPSLIDPNGYLASVSCASVHACVAVDWSGRAFLWNGRTWSKPMAIDRDALTAVSCPMPRYCVAVDSRGGVLTWDGVAWRLQLLADASEFDSVSCYSSAFCAAGSWSWVNTAFVKHGGSWSVTKLQGTEPLYWVSCPTQSHCEAVGAFGSFSWSGSRWVLSGRTGMSAVSCAQPSFCMGAAPTGKAYIWNGRTWSGHTMLANDAIEVVSCPTRNFCMALDSQGNAYTWRRAG